MTVGAYLEDDLALAALQGTAVEELDDTARGHVCGAAQDEQVLDPTSLEERWASEGQSQRVGDREIVTSGR